MKAYVLYLTVRRTATTVLIGEGPFRRELIHNTIRAYDLIGDTRGCVGLNSRMSPWRIDVTVARIYGNLPMISLK